jgi:hypothetical protein
MAVFGGIIFLMAIGSMDDVCQRGIILKSIGFILTRLIASTPN